MGGEPTFVAVDDPDGAEWNIDALGPDQAPARRRAARAAARPLRARRVRARGAGQVVSGRAAPALVLRAATGGATASRRGPTPRLIADEREPAGHTAPDAERFVRHLATRLGVSDEYVQPGFEDVWYYLWRERRLPVNVDPFDSRLDDELERARLRRVFSQKLDTVVGYALPLEPLGGSRRALALGALVHARRADVSDPRRLADGLSPAARRRCRGPPPAIVRRSSRPIRSRRARRSRPTRCCAPPRCTQPSSTGRRAGDCVDPPQGRTQGRTSVRPRRSRRIGARPGANRALHRGARRRAVRVHAAGRHARRVPRARGGHRSHGRGSRRCRCCSKATVRRRIRGLRNVLVTPDPGVIEVNVPPASHVGRAGRSDDVALRGRAPVAPHVREVHARRPSHRHRRRQSLRARRRHRRRQPAAAASRSAAQPAGVLAQPSVAVVPLLRSLHRADQPGAARGRSAPRQHLRAGDRLRQGAALRRRRAAVARRPPVPPPAGGRHRQHAPRGVLHRQAVLARHGAGTPRAARAARLRDAAARADERRAAAAAQGAGRALLAGAVHRAAHAVGHRAARSLHAAVLRRARFRRRPARDARQRVRVRRRLVRAALRVPVPARRPDGGARRAAHAATGARAVARPRRRGRGRRHGALRGLVGRAAAGPHDRPHTGALPRRLQRPRAAAAAHGEERRVRRRRAVQGVAAALGASPDDSGARAADFRYCGHLVRAIARRLPIPRDAPGRTQLRPLPREQLRGREPPAGALLRDGPHARPSGRWRRPHRTREFPYTLDLRT